MSDETTVFSTSDAGVATITLNRPQVYNAFNAQLHRELYAALREAERNGAVRCVVITGAGKAFCSGQDLKEVPEDAGPMVSEAIRKRYNPLVLKLRKLGKPVIAAVNGVAAGAGLSLALACDLRIAAQSARFSAAFVNIALVPDSGLTYFLPRLIGHGRALEMALLGQPIDATTALSWGLVNRVTGDEEFPDAVQALAAQLAAGPTRTLSLIRRNFDYAQDASLEQVLEWEAQAQQAAIDGGEYNEGVAAFREKRRPEYLGGYRVQVLLSLYPVSYFLVLALKNRSARR
ncbi:2-(1,2-epoxy-1,2-dihydrophenyl)acetyl-CoA isomerase [Candidatus Gracilibacteria bacterium]|nr:2-(1,2-epoxy-1,2-dihydrophenyl)acetyl-CoA isomerase [Candidatus Gracilibacteria bacterium]